MVTTSRKFALIIRSRAAASPFLIFPASSISSCGVKRGNCPISCKYLFNPKSVSFMAGTYSPRQAGRYCASVGFLGATLELVPATSLEISDCDLAKANRQGG
jgi:hypothetical protein